MGTPFLSSYFLRSSPGDDSKVVILLGDGRAAGDKGFPVCTFRAARPP